MFKRIRTWVKTGFAKNTLVQVAAAELAQAELEKLQAQTGMEFQKSVVNYNDERIKRLKKFIQENTEQ